MSALAQAKVSPPLSPSANAFLEARGLDPELCERLGLTSGQDRNGREWISIPYERNGVRVNRKFRAIEEKAFRQDQGGEQILWRFDCVGDAGLADQPLVITEGEFDAIAAIQAGFWRSVSVPGGAPAQATENILDQRMQRFAFLDSAMTALNPVKEIIIASDGDTPGAALLSDLTALLSPSRCKFVTYPPGCKDLNDVLRQHGADGVKKVLAEARWVNVAGVYRLSELPPLAPLTVWRPQVFEPADRLIAVCPGHVSVWTGLAGDGKSTFVNAVMWSIAQRYNVRIAAAPFEATPQREYMDDLTAFRTGKPSDAWTIDDITSVRTWAEEHLVFLYADGFATPGKTDLIDATIDWFIRAAQTAVVRHGCRIIVLDPWSQMDHDIGSEREDQYVRRVLKRFKAFARAFDVHVAIVAHPAKPKRNMDGTYPVPEGYDISGAAHWKNAPDLGVTVYRDPPSIQDPNGEEGDLIPDPNSTRTLIRAWKVKHHRSMNRPGDAYASLDLRTGRYHSPEHWDAFTPTKRYAPPQRRTEIDE